MKLAWSYKKVWIFTVVLPKLKFIFFILKEKTGKSSSARMLWTKFWYCSLILTLVNPTGTETKCVGIACLRAFSTATSKASRHFRTFSADCGEVISNKKIFFENFLLEKRIKLKKNPQTNFSHFSMNFFFLLGVMYFAAKFFFHYSLFITFFAFN